MGGDEVVEEVEARRLDAEFRVVCTKTRSDVAGERRLVVAGVSGKPDRKRLDAGPLRLRQKPNNYGRIDASRQERPERHIGFEAPFNGGRDEATEFGGGRRHVEPFQGRVDRWQVPIAGYARNRPRIEHEDVAGGTSRTPSWKVSGPGTLQCFWLGGEAQLLTVKRVKERLLPGAIAAQQRASLRSVKDAEGEHTIEPVNDRIAKCPIPFENHLTIATPAKLVPACAELFADLVMIVDLAIEYENRRPIRRHHWLMTGGRQIENRKARKAENRVLPSVGTRVIGAAAMKRRESRVNVDPFRVPRKEATEDAAHRFVLSLRGKVSELQRLTESSAASSEGRIVAERGGRRTTFLESRKPDVEGQEEEDAQPVIGAPFLLFLEEFADEVATDVVPDRARIGKRIFDKASQRAIQPRDEWHAEPHLRAVNDFRRDKVFVGPLQNPLRSEAAAEEAIGETRGELDDGTIKKRGPELYGVEHACAVGLEEEVVREVRLKIIGKKFQRVV
ncbi:hypothetical protein OUZ56_032459 [Daphnia magna]|uniref:Uncharacterized protein n=1 Tax=Daphnia magna TaxID=35525 RepID=A0ABR0B8Y8_9CRUS|nr:hypothetical protein OUZ56_032459 [Daphnia magna]